MASGYSIVQTDTHPLVENTPVGTVLATLIPVKPDDGTPIPGGSDALGVTYEIGSQERWERFYSGAEDFQEFKGGFAIVGDHLVTAMVFNYETNGYAGDGWIHYEVGVVAHDAAGNESRRVLNFTVQDVIETIKGTDKGETLGGGAGADRLLGFDGRDALFGKLGDDILWGGRGADMLSGESGADTFLYKSRLESTTAAPDRITDFETKIDHIDLSLIDANSRKAGNQAFTWIGSKDFTGHAGELRAVNRDGDTFVYADVNGDRKADMAIRVDDTPKLHSYDFIL